MTSIPAWWLSECAMAMLNPSNDVVLLSILARFNPHIRCIEHWNQTIHACNSAAAVLFWILTCEVSSICNSTRAIRIQHDNSADHPSACRHGTSTSSTFVKQLLAFMWLTDAPRQTPTCDNGDPVSMKASPFESKVQVFITWSHRSTTWEADTHRPRSWQNGLPVAMASVEWPPLNLSPVVESSGAHCHILPLCDSWSVRQWWLPQRTCHHVAVKYRSICFLQVLSACHRCHTASRGTDSVIRVELISVVPCSMGSASQCLTMFRYTMPSWFCKGGHRLLMASCLLEVR